MFIQLVLTSFIAAVFLVTIVTVGVWSFVKLMDGVDYGKFKDIIIGLVGFVIVLTMGFTTILWTNGNILPKQNRIQQTNQVTQIEQSK